MTRVIDKPKGQKHMGAEYRHLAEVLGLDLRNYKMQVALTPEDRARAEDFIHARDLASGYAVICPFTTRPQKHWLSYNWPLLARRLSVELNLRVVLLGGPGDRAAAAEFTAADLSLVDAVGATTLREAAALIERARLLVGVDTALTHIGTAFEVPTIALFGSTCPYRVTDSAKTIVLYKGLPCSPCKRRPTCHGAYTCMREITVDEVATTARRLLAPA